MFHIEIGLRAENIDTIVGTTNVMGSVSVVMCIDIYNSRGSQWMVQQSNDATSPS